MIHSRGRSIRRRTARRLLRSRRAAASAVAVLFCILILATAISTYVSTQLPAAMTTAEFDHTLEVENQFVQVQADILTEAAHSNVPMAITSPITLSSDGVPPFGQPAISTISVVQSNTAQARYNYSIGSFSYNGPTIWQHGTLCLSNNSCTNSNNNGAYWYNWEGSNQQLIFNSITGTGNRINVNISGNNNLVVFPETGTSEVAINIFLVGNSNTMFFNYSGSSAYGTNLNVYGEGNIVHFGKSSVSNLKFVVNFVGWTALNNICPWQNSSSTNFFVVDAGSSGTHGSAYINWYNSIGYQHQSVYTGAWPGGTGSVTETQNYTSGTVACAWEAGTSQAYAASEGSGLSDVLSNRYYPAATVALQDGAVVAEFPSNQSTMLAPPLLTIAHGTYGPVINLTLMQFVVNGFSEETGSGTVGIQTSLLSLTTSDVYVNGVGAANGGSLELPEYLTITTAAPEAWLNWALNYPSVIPYGAFIYGTSTYKHGCGLYQGTNVCTVVVPFYAYGVTLRTATVALSVT